LRNDRRTSNATVALGMARSIRLNKSIDAIELESMVHVHDAILVVAAQQEDALRVLDFEGKQQGHHLVGHELNMDIKEKKNRKIMT
jgi:hypothetical protein